MRLNVDIPLYVRTCCSFALSMLGQLVFSQQGYNVSNYSIGEGLIQSQVRAISQDKKGFIWLGTHRGLCRFDGKNFEDYQPENGLAGRFVSAITQDKDNNLWVGTERGVSKFDGARFQNITKENGLTSHTILSLLCDHNGRIWIGTKGGGILYYENGKASPFSATAPSNIHTLVQDSVSHKIWVGTNEGLFYLTQEGLERAKNFPEIEVFCVLPDPKAGLWLGTNKGIIRYKEERTIFFSQNIKDKNIYCLVQDSDKKIWAGTGNGIAVLEYSLHRESEEILVQTIPFEAQKWSNQNTVTSARKDGEGNLWFGTEGEGVFKIRKGAFELYSPSEGMNSKIAKSFLEDTLGNIWISSTNNGVSILQAAPQTANIFYYITKEDGLSGNDICNTFQDSKGNFWFATYAHGVSYYNSSGRFNNFNTYNGLSSDKSFIVAEDNKGRIWIGTDAGISIWNGEYFDYLTTKNGLLSDNVYSILPDSKGNIWIGSPEGITLIDSKNIVRHFTRQDGLGDNLVLSIKEDKWGGIWVATSGGLGKWDGNQWKTIKLPGNTAANDIVSLVFDMSYAHLWIGTNYGIFRMNIGKSPTDSSYTFEQFTLNDGLPSLECNGNAAFRDKKGNIWIGTIAGAVCYKNSNEKALSDLPPKCYITDIKLFFKEPDQWKKSFSDINPITGLPENLSFDYDQNHITFGFIGICYNKPSAVRYQIMLEGFDEGWLPATDETKFTYSFLPPGSYTFRVRTTTNLQDWQEAVPFSFTIQPPFWRSGWFIITALLSILGILGGVYIYFRDKALQKREKEAIQQKSDKLILEQQALYAMMNPHFTFNALQSIQYFIHTQDKVAATKFLSQFAKLVRMNLDSSKTEFISLNEEMERLKLYLSLEKMRFQEKFDYDIRIAAGIDKSETQIPPMILQPFVENSIKHGIMPLGEKGEIFVSVELLESDTLKVTIQDNGIGIEASKKLKENRVSDHVSKGMQITQDRLSLFSKTSGKEYKVEIKEIKGEDEKVIGTAVVILLPTHLHT